MVPSRCLQGAFAFADWYDEKGASAVGGAFVAGDSGPSVAIRIRRSASRPGARACGAHHHRGYKGRAGPVNDVEAVRRNVRR